MVQPDVAGQELQDLRQPQVGAAFERGVVVAPRLARLPVGVLELVLDVEEPDADAARQQERGQLHDQESRPPEQPAERGDEDDEGEVRAECAPPKPPGGRPGNDPWLEHEHPERAEPEHHERVSEQPVAEPSPPRPGSILVDRQRLDVADTATVEVAGGRVMNSVLAPPDRERGDRRARPTSPRVGRSRASTAGTNRARSRGRR